MRKDRIMNIFIVYYSRTGRTRKIAEQLSSKLPAEIEEVKDDKNRKGLLGFITSGNEAYLRKVIPIDKLKDNLAQYDCVIIGTPVWANNISTPIRSFLEKYKNQFKRVAFFCTSLGSDAKSVFTAMERIIGQKPLAVMNITARDLKKQYDIEMVDEYIQKIKKIDRETNKLRDDG